MLADLLGPAMFTNSFGLLLLFQGVATIIGPPIVGKVFNNSFGLLLLFQGVATIIGPPIVGKVYSMVWQPLLALLL